MEDRRNLEDLIMRIPKGDQRDLFLARVAAAGAQRIAVLGAQQNHMQMEVMELEIQSTELRQTVTRLQRELRATQKEGAKRLNQVESKMQDFKKLRDEQLASGHRKADGLNRAGNGSMLAAIPMAVVNPLLGAALAGAGLASKVAGAIFRPTMPFEKDIDAYKKKYPGVTHEATIMRLQSLDLFQESALEAYMQKHKISRTVAIPRLIVEKEIYECGRTAIDDSIYHDITIESNLPPWLVPKIQEAFDKTKEEAKVYLNEIISRQYCEIEAMRKKRSRGTSWAGPSI